MLYCAGPLSGHVAPVRLTNDLSGFISQTAITCPPGLTTTRNRPAFGHRERSPPHVGSVSLFEGRLTETVLKLHPVPSHLAPPARSHVRIPY
jgi:hypothetical protein